MPAPPPPASPDLVVKESAHDTHWEHLYVIAVCRKGGMHSAHPRGPEVISSDDFHLEEVAKRCSLPAALSPRRRLIPFQEVFFFSTWLIQRFRSPARNCFPLRPQHLHTGVWFLPVTLGDICSAHTLGLCTHASQTVRKGVSSLFKQSVHRWGLSCLDVCWSASLHTGRLVGC